MENRGLLFIPDISGFTRFINEIEIDHGRYIIQELLEVLISANNTGLEVSEIEGDAILFYKFGEPLELETLYKQVESMFCAFHRHLNVYNSRKICQCKACVSAVDLTLKVITHYGEFTTYNVRNFYKLIGKDVIVAHQLLKNDITQHEYWLVTDNLLQGAAPADLARWMKWDSSTKLMDAGRISFHYTQLSPLKKELPPDPDPSIRLSGKVKMASLSRAYPVDIKTLCFTVVHFEFRNLWQVGVKTVDEVEHFLPGVGSRHRYVLDNGREVMMFISSFSYNPEERILYSETDEKRKTVTCYTLEKIDAHHSRLTMEVYLHRNVLQQLLFNFFEKSKLETRWRQSLESLAPIVKEMILPLEF